MSLLKENVLKLDGTQELKGATAQVIEDVACFDSVKKVAVLPDIHYKGTMEFPSSSAVGVDRTIYPHLTSNSVNCGMALVRTNLEADRLTEKDFDALFHSVKSNFPSQTLNYSLTVPEVLEVLVHGASWALPRYGFDQKEFHHVAQGVRSTAQIPIPTDYREVERLHEHSADLLQESCLNFGEIGKSNHFIELQRVDEIYDQKLANLFQIEIGQLLIMYHGGGGAYCGLIGNLFVPRKKGDWYGKLYNLARRKIPFHLMTATSIRQFLKRLNYYCVNHDWLGISELDEEAERFLTYDTFSMNYGYAYRISTLSMLQKSLEQVTGVKEFSLIYDLPHNLITQEVVNGEQMYVHRHNTNPCYPASMLSDHPLFKETGQPVFLPGTNQTSSFLCVADQGAEKTLFSVDHGAGHTVKRHIEEEKSLPISGSTRRYRYHTDVVDQVNHYDDVGVRAVLDPLVNAQIVRTVARTTPIACLT